MTKSLIAPAQLTHGSAVPISCHGNTRGTVQLRPVEKPELCVILVRRRAYGCGDDADGDERVGAAHRARGLHACAHSKGHSSRQPKHAVSERQERSRERRARQAKQDFPRFRAGGSVTYRSPGGRRGMPARPARRC